VKVNVGGAGDYIPKVDAKIQRIKKDIRASKGAAMELATCDDQGYSGNM
jgi:hypothetical protein